jgi:hypothetical protein
MEAVMTRVRVYQLTEHEVRIARWRMLGLTGLAWATLAVMWLAGS